jgi:hypothetical protein
MAMAVVCVDIAAEPVRVQRPFSFPTDQVQGEIHLRALWA